MEDFLTWLEDAKLQIEAQRKEFVDQLSLNSIGVYKREGALELIEIIKQQLTTSAESGAAPESDEPAR